MQDGVFSLQTSLTCLKKLPQQDMMPSSTSETFQVNWIRMLQTRTRSW